MDDDDKFWKIPEGRSWAEAGPVLRRLKSGKGAAPAKPRRLTKVNWTAQERADQFAKVAAFYRHIGQDYEADQFAQVAAFYRRIGQDYEAGEYERRAAAILAAIAAAQVRHG